MISGLASGYAITLLPSFPMSHAKLVLRVVSTTLYVSPQPDTFICQFISSSHQGIVTKFVLKAYPQGEVWVINPCFWPTSSFSISINEGWLHHNSYLVLRRGQCSDRQVPERS